MSDGEPKVWDDEVMAWKDIPYAEEVKEKEEGPVVGEGECTVCLLTSIFTGVGFDKMNWPWPFGALLGFFGALVLIVLLMGFAHYVEKRWK